MTGGAHAAAALSSEPVRPPRPKGLSHRSSGRGNGPGASATATVSDKVTAPAQTAVRRQRGDTNLPSGNRNRVSTNSANTAGNAIHVETQPAPPAHPEAPAPELSHRSAHSSAVDSTRPNVAPPTNTHP